MFCGYPSAILVMQSLIRSLCVENNRIPFVFLIIILILYEPVGESLSNTYKKKERLPGTDLRHNDDA